MFEFFSQILGYLQVAWEYLSHFFSSVFSFFSLFPNIINAFSSLYDILPSFIALSLLIVVSLGVIKAIVGR